MFSSIFNIYPIYGDGIFCPRRRLARITYIPLASTTEYTTLTIRELVVALVLALALVSTSPCTSTNTNTNANHNQLY